MDVVTVVFAVVNIVAIILIPIVAVWIGQRLQNRAKIREDKMLIFRTLMANRNYGWASKDCVYALNIIEIAFYNSKKVREEWDKYLDYIGRPSSEISVRTLNIMRTKLLEAIADDLGYKSKITWETIQNDYTPIGFSDYLQKEAQIQSGQAKIATLIDGFMNLMSNPTNTTGLGKQVIKSFLNDFGDAASEWIQEKFAGASDATEESKHEPTTTGTDVDGETREEDKSRTTNID